MANFILLLLCIVVHLTPKVAPQCNPINLPPYGIYLRGPCPTYTGSICYIGCEPNFDLLGSCFRICGNNGSWSGVPVSCIRSSIQCPRLDLSGGVQLISGCQNMAGFQCDFGCPAGTLSGPRSIYCQITGQWSAQVPSCQAGQVTTQPTYGCYQLYPPQNGFFTAGVCSTNVGSNCQVTCDQGYLISGTNPIQCLSSGWSAPVPQCLETYRPTCPSLPLPLNGNYLGTCTTFAQPGQTCTFNCNTGYQLTGQATLSCGPTGAWSPAVPPRCDSFSCTVMNPPVNGQISGQCIPGVAGEQCSFNCFPGYRLVGNAVLTCQSNGQWSGQPPTCEADGCGNLAVPIGGFWETGGSITLTPCPGTPGATCTLICSQGYVLQGQATTSCQSTGSVYQWAPQVGTCYRTSATVNSGSDKLIRSSALEREETTAKPKKFCIKRKTNKG